MLDAKQGGTASEEGNESERITLNQDDLNEDAKDADHSEELALLAAIKEEAEAALSNDGVKPVLKEEPPEVVQKNSSQGNEGKRNFFVIIITLRRLVFQSKSDPKARNTVNLHLKFW